MVTIPARAPMSAPRTPTARGGRAALGDLGLGAVGEALARTGRGMQTNADERAKTAFDDMQTQFDETYLRDAHSYDGRAPGFARAQMARFDGAAAAAAEVLDDDARQSFERLRPARRTAQFEAAIRVESQRSAERETADRERGWTLDAINRTAGMRVAYAQRKRDLLDEYDGSQPGLRDNALTALDEEIATALEAAPPEVRERLAVQLASARADEMLSLQLVEDRARQAHEATTATKAAEGLVSAVISDPGQYDGVMRDVAQLGVELPVTLRQQMQEDTGRAVTVARFEGMLQRGQWDVVLREIDSGAWDDRLGADAKTQVRQLAIQHRQAAGFDPVSVQRQLDQNTMEQRVQSEIASLVATGQTTGLTGQDVRAVGGPVAEAEFNRQAENARLAYSVTRGLAGLPPAEQLARVESLKPKGGEPDFAQRQAIYQLAVQSLDQARTVQRTDPARATQTSEANASMWRNFEANPNSINAGMWASDTLMRQREAGVPETAQRILPVEYARALAGRVKSAEGADTLPALQSAAALVSQFGGREGQILTELTRAGLTPADAAIIGQAGDNPVALADYARARARGNVGLPAPVRRDVRTEVVRRLEPLLETWAPLPGGQAGSDALVSGIETVAAAYAADGMSPRRAAEAATQTYLDSYRFNNGWRMPASLTAGQRIVAEPYSWERSGNAVLSARGVGGPQQRRNMTPIDAAELGAHRFMTDLVREQGGLFPAGSEPHLSDGQKRARVADIVASRGRWISTLDDGGLMLVIPDPRNPRGVVPVLGADGQPVRRTWDQLFARAAQPSRPRQTR